MTFITYLHKGKWIIRVSGHDGKYLLEYSEDQLNSKTTKSYESKEELLQVLASRFSEEELKLIRQFENDPG